RNTGKTTDWAFIENIVRDRYVDLSARRARKREKGRPCQALVVQTLSVGYTSSGNGEGGRRGKKGRAKGDKKRHGQGTWHGAGSRAKALGSGSAGGKGPTAPGPKTRTRAEKGRCYRCHRTRHFSYQCPETRCSICRKWGHATGACPEENCSSSSSAEEGNFAASGTFATGKYGDLCLVAKGRIL
ncbi:unnamed protein product, partial [Discosporangium mesarthrocarpum]